MQDFSLKHPTAPNICPLLAIAYHSDADTPTPDFLPLVSHHTHP